MVKFVDEHVLDMLPGYALDCLDEDEAILVSEHLARCAGCRAELRAYQATVDRLALGVVEATPPAALQARLLDRIQMGEPDDPARPELSWWQSLGMFMRRTTPAWGAASLILILVLALANLWLWQRINTLEADLLPEDSLRTITLTGTEFVPTATGLIVISLDGFHGTLVVDQLPELDEAHQYQLWLIEDGQRENGGVFSVSQEGYGSVWLDSPRPLASYSAFGVTIEPAGGSPGPTGQKVLGGSL